MEYKQQDEADQQERETIVSNLTASTQIDQEREIEIEREQLEESRREQVEEERSRTENQYNIHHISWEEFMGLPTMIYIPHRSVIKMARVINIIFQKLEDAVTEEEQENAYKWYYAFPQVFLYEPYGGRKTHEIRANQIDRRLEAFLRGDYNVVLNMESKKRKAI